MAVLKDHLLREIVNDLCGREDAKKRDGFITALPSVEKFILAGKEPFRVFRRIVQDNVTVTFVTSDSVRMTYSAGKSVFLFDSIYVPKYPEYSWNLGQVWLNKLFITWARKLSTEETKWYASPRTGYAKFMAGKSDLEQLCVDNDKFNDWAAILKVFPKPIVLHISARNLSSLLLVASTELAGLKEIAFRNTARRLVVAHQNLSLHQSKYPNLDTIRYHLTQLEEIRFPASVNMPSIEHITIDCPNPKCCTPWNFAFLTAFQKAFPWLESVEVDVYTECHCYYESHAISQKLKIVDAFYQAFQELNFEFTVKITFSETITLYEDYHDGELDYNPLHPHFMTKGKVSGTPEKFTVKTSYPGKELIYEVNIRQYDHDTDYVHDDYDSPLDYAYRMMGRYDDDYDYL